MAVLSTGPIENNVVAGNGRPTQRITVRLDNRNAISIYTVLVQGYYLVGVRTLYIEELFNVLPNQVITKDFYADLDGFEFVFTTGDATVEDVQISVWGKNQNGELVTAHRLVSEELLGAYSGISGVTGATGSTAASAPADSSLFADSQTTALPLPLTGETIIQTLNVPVVAGQRVKIDNSTQVAVVVGSNWSIAYNINLRRNGVLINQLQLSRTGNAAGTLRFLSSNTYVDTSPATTTNAYTISIEFTTTSNVTSASAEVRNVNAIRFS